MNESSDNHLDLKRQLDEAARLCQAEHPGWESLLERLPPQHPADKDPPTAGQPPKVATPRKPPRWSALAVAASLLLLRIGVVLAALCIKEEQGGWA